MMNKPSGMNNFLARFQLQMPLAGCPPSGGRHAAVLVPIVNRPQPGLLLTRRATSLRQHAGQVAFPGGMQDDSDAGLLDTALREAEEEIALMRHQVRIIGCLPAVSSASGFLVTPFLAIIPPDLPLHASQQEVDAIFEIPLQQALDTARYGALTVHHRGQLRQVWCSYFDQHLIWGMTAGIIRQLSLQVSATRDF
ncbi:CoA pyrophosphatase [Erwinia sp. OLTSP20]|uniref:CoA pyrophosphatase n=1 Tax=unclassified Erwinia TaxID=2622719 RepID=UPI000C196C4F|nr:MULTISPECIES: CoA pyrophosphatase [unclassified Erwinia]PIJ51423.1 CoA pyrophosphatase [Erwinia sp. OAMSP11]PIJ73445.1 CoA pyrophosphatase [Erwinia sp. OLSSP12]PIJ85508.1 CoA pyrophosphatase [Erwinia sp. OLCASP19]PIJ85906.1 CoA pyrophosphatase [Erwinia sp. OLMTSP26]PIJ87387.1 CoA pyrophosphatase [Erwinia sp. OLMDSP33]